jgi:hypothetical protein
MRGTIPIRTCDHEDGCDDWMIDHREMEVDNWRDLLGGWEFDPRRDESFCPEHKGDQR